MHKDFLDNHPALQVIRESVDDNAEEENEQVQVGWKWASLNKITSNIFPM